MDRMPTGLFCASKAKEIHDRNSSDRPIEIIQQA